MRLSKAAICAACGKKISQHPFTEGMHPVVKCRNCNHLQVVELVKDYAWEDRGNVHRAVEKTTGKCLASISCGVGSVLFSVGVGYPIQEATSLESAKAIVDNILNGTSN